MTRILSAKPREEDWYWPLEEALRLYRLPYYHTRSSRGSVAGWPDYAILAGRWLLFAEIKTEGGSPTEAQWAWLRGLRGPWRLSALVDGREYLALAELAVDMQAGRLDAIGPAGLVAVVCLGSVRVPDRPAFAGERIAAAELPSLAAAAGRTPTPER